MLFHSLEFAVFLPIVFALYWFVFQKSLRAQNWLLLVASYVFYGWWDWRFLSLIFVSSVVDFFVGRALDGESRPARRKLLLTTSMVFNLGLLGICKYFNFFLESFASAFALFGHELSVRSLSIVLPVGISFYTFQTMSYTIDVYRRDARATRDFVSFLAYVSFFPQLVAGPIERAVRLIPQFERTRVFDRALAVDGLRQALWGLFKKIVIADNCASYANAVFDNSASLSGSTLALGAIAFAFQIYGDFSGYSDIALGTSRLFGFDLMRNFAYPYFSRDISEFWRRWHISLSTWFRDYLYIPLGGSRVSRLYAVRNTMIIFLVSGFWHGANWTFLFWGALHALLFLPLLLTNKNRTHLGLVAAGRRLPNVSELASMLTTFATVTLAWIFFRASSISHAFSILSEIFSPSLFAHPDPIATDTPLVALVIAFVIAEWIGREHDHPLRKIGIEWPTVARWALYYTLMLLIYVYAGAKQQFIYFQF